MNPVLFSHLSSLCFKSDSWPLLGRCYAAAWPLLVRCLLLLNNSLLYLSLHPGKECSTVKTLHVRDNFKGGIVR
jgi:hypothetical protein